MPQDQAKDKPVETVKENVSTPPVKKKGISPWIIVLIVALILIPCILCFVFMILPLLLTASTVSTQLSTSSTVSSMYTDLYSSTSSDENLLTSSATSSSDITYDGTTSVASSSTSSRASSTTSIASTASSSVASTTTSSSSSSVPFAVTGITISANPTTPDHSLQCGELYTFPFTGSVTANGAGTFSYYWYRQDTGRYPVQTVTFTSAGTKQITKDVTVKANEVDENPHFYSGYFQVQVFENVEPAVLKSNVVSINYNVACVP